MDEELSRKETEVARLLKLHKEQIDAKSLASYRLILNDAQAKLTTWQTTLAKVNNDLQSQLNQLLTLLG